MSYSSLIQIWISNFQVSFRSEWHFMSKWSLILICKSYVTKHDMRGYKARFLLLDKFEWHDASHDTKLKYNRWGNHSLTNVHSSPGLTNFSHVQYQSEKVDAILDQIRLKGLQMVLLECPGHWNPYYYSILRVVDKLVINVLFRSEWHFKSRWSLILINES